MIVLKGNNGVRLNVFRNRSRGERWLFWYFLYFFRKEIKDLAFERVGGISCYSTNQKTIYKIKIKLKTRKSKVCDNSYGRQTCLLKRNYSLVISYWFVELSRPCFSWSVVFVDIGCGVVPKSLILWILVSPKSLKLYEVILDLQVAIHAIDTMRKTNSALYGCVF